MKQAGDQAEPVPPMPEGNHALEAVLAYEDFATGMRGKRVLDGLTQALSGTLTLTFKLWKFDILQVPSLQGMAADDAAHADVVLVAAHGGGDLPEVVKHWFRLWVPRKRPQPRALVCLLDPLPGSSAQPSPVSDYLCQIARQGRMDFFCAGGENPVARVPLPSRRMDGVAEAWSRVDVLLRRSTPEPALGFDGERFRPRVL